MTAIDYLKSLIAGQTVSSIPVQVSELEFLLKLMQGEKIAASDDGMTGPLIKLFRD